MDVKINYDEDADLYELGGTQDGVFVPFTGLPGTTVRARIAAVQASQTAEQTASAATGRTTPTGAGTPAGGASQAELDAANARVAELEAQLQAGGGGGGGGQRI